MKDILVLQKQLERQGPESLARKKGVELAALLNGFGKLDSPSNVAEQSLAAVAFDKKPALIFGFWGIGSKPEIDTDDEGFMDNLLRLKKTIQEAYAPGANVYIILADEHAVFNGHLQNKNDSRYLMQIDEALHARGLQTVPLSTLYKEHQLEQPGRIPLHNLITRRAVEIFEDKRRRERFEKSALEHNLQDYPPHEAAQAYIEMRLREHIILRRIAQQHHGIFFVNGGKDLAAPLMPKDIPILYLTNAPPIWFGRRKLKGGETI